MEQLGAFGASGEVLGGLRSNAGGVGGGWRGGEVNGRMLWGNWGNSGNCRGIPVFCETHIPPILSMGIPVTPWNYKWGSTTQGEIWGCGGSGRGNRMPWGAIQGS